MTRARSWIVGLCLGLLGLGLALGRQGYLDAQARDAAALAAKTPAPRRGDGYVSSDTCVGCHPDTHESWRRSFHRTMTQLATPAAVRAPFDGVTLRAGGRDYKLSREGDTFLVEMPDWEWARAQARRGVDTDAPGYAGELPRRRFQVVMTTGSHHMQTYWVEGSRGNEVYNLPFVYLFADERAGDEGRWLPREEVFLRPPDAPPFRQTWNDNCILCHSTGPQPGLSKDGVDTRVAELGIGCEACHGPGAAHVERHRAPLARYERRLDDVPDDTIVNPARLPPARAAAVCGQCHAKTFINDQRAWLEHGMTFKPGEDLERERTMVLPRSRPEHPWLRASARRDPAFIGQFFWPDGMIRVSGREYNGVVESRCATAGEMTCTSCHSMHRGAPAMQLQPSDAALVDPGDAGCRECHAPLFADVAAHTRHAPDSQGSACVNCHMPYTTYGLLRALRSHLVDSPTVRVSLESGRPNACNLCHLDRTLAWTSEQLAAGWGQPPTAVPDDWKDISAGTRWLLAGDASQRALLAWAFGWAPARAAAGDEWMAPLLAQLLDDPYAAVRFIAGRALASLPGQAQLEYDFLAPERARRAARDAAIDRWRAQPGAPKERVFQDERGALDVAGLHALTRARDDRPVDLRE